MILTIIITTIICYYIDEARYNSKHEKNKIEHKFIINKQ